MKVSGLFSLAAVVSSAVVSAAPVLLSARQYSGNTYNQLIDGTPCRDVTLIYARGTIQQGNVGDPAAVGPLMFNALAALLGTNKLAVQGVTYPASILGFLLGGDPDGANTMTAHVARAATQCPNTKIILSGYSQGAQLVHRTAGQLTADVAGKVTAVLTLGDPFMKRTLANIPASKHRVICHDGDNICEGGIIVNDKHTNYQEDAGDAALWMMSRVR
ncbi:hypothetical protein GGTG_12644 [Gaeumannomyces tritici R3-111a-1]|uniref:Cutinase n=1 Tax=Gaeumannomyces tritici (strain R3-111a-1) TaxID=644352 RepID=J3PGL5_GAET3|nr:hypothetical protein GGTG_12644 [Gaeumannomyces tritici R3-111a-1]EJT69761.1 hypothetical protein GGTG_12644 [Gaeumannomyces tritici R3-111a-1]